MRNDGEENPDEKSEQNWLIHIVGKQKEIRDEKYVCILLVPINQVNVGNVVGDHVLIDDLIIDIGYAYLDMCGALLEKTAGRRPRTHFHFHQTNS